MISLLASTRRPDITFYHSGRIDISSYVSKQLDILPGDVIDVIAHQGEYYLYVRIRRAFGRHEGICFSSNNRVKNSRSLRAHSVRLCRALLCITGSRDRASLPCGVPCEQPFGKAIPIITRNKL